MIRSPPASSPPSGALPSPNSAMRPSASAIQPRSITRSASTMRALPRMVSGFVVISKHLSSGSGSKRGHVDDPVGDLLADFIVMDDRHHGDALTFLLFDQLNHDRAVGGVERGGRLVQQQDRQIGNESPGDIDPLLLTAGERRGRQR